VRYSTLSPFRPEKVHCGWHVKNPRCEVEWSTTEKITWMRWEQRERGKNRETGEAVMCAEFVPHTGTRAEFMEEFVAKFEEWMPHVYRDRNTKFMVKLQLERMASPEQMERPSVLMSRVDFGTAVEIPRIYSATCSYPERFNVCCTVAVYRPHLVKDYRRSWKQRKVWH